jgi:death on curing protein
MIEEVEWIEADVTLAYHKRQIAEHGGTEGLRDEGLLLSALARPQNLIAYGEDVDIAGLAASYAFGIAKNHPFLDGNKRTALVVSISFLNLNGYDFDVDPAETYEVFYDLAQGVLSEDELADWFRRIIYRMPE